MYIEGSIDLAETLIIPEEGFRPCNLDGKATIEMISSDISATKSFAVEMSLSKTNWVAAKDAAGTAITGNIVKDTAVIIPINLNPHLHWRVKIATGATGSVNYIIHD